MADITALMDIVSGLVLLTGVMALIPAVGKYLEKACKAMAAYQVPIGVISLIVGILALLDVISGGLVPSVFAILAGIVLAISVLGALPAVGKVLQKVAKAIGGVQVIFGIIVLIVGILYL
ncbi:MAG: hypothetical protein QW098_04710 [Candidatus Hadarchaeales archaeon]